MATVSGTAVQRVNGRRRRQWEKTALRVGLLLFLLIVWEIVGRRSDGLSMPTFSKTVAAWLELLAGGQLLPAFATSTATLFLGFGVALVVSLVVGIVIGRIPWLERFVNPYLNVLLAIPMVALVPIIVAMLGLSLEARVVIIFLFAFPVITANVATGISNVPKDVIEMGRSFCATEFQLLRHIIIPAAVPTIVTGLRVGLGLALVGMIIAELTILAAGIGTLILQYRSFRPNHLFAVVLTVIVQGVLLMSLMQWAEHKLTRWRGGSDE